MSESKANISPEARAQKRAAYLKAKEIKGPETRTFKSIRTVESEKIRAAMDKARIVAAATGRRMMHRRKTG